MSTCSWPIVLPSTTPQTNLEGFLQCVTPVVPSKFLPQSCFHELNSLWQPLSCKDTVEYFTLGDLWNCYSEWSAYGAGTPVTLSTGETITQYYVPYLSAIQLYTNKSVPASRGSRYNDVLEMESDSWSDDSTSDKLSRSLSNNSSKTWDSISEDSSFEHEGSLPMMDKLGCIDLQYFELCSPYWRVPLMEKIAELSKNYPGLMTLKNVDLSPASWMAVAWYPIYHIPSRRCEKDLSTCFLTYHTLSSSFQDCLDEYDDMVGSFKVTEKATGCKSKGEGSGGIYLPPFGLATYKMQGDLWADPETSDPERLIDLHSAADSWLKQLNAHHHDFNFFSYHSTSSV